ncbi:MULTISPECIES: YidH family protein [Streptomyces]|uniref:DUF202 domain-containing protein n=1 Tax=Streptomyces flaveolus TaxID=67297 RepID=A0ABV3AIN9_9ACTN|nr:MULTISPECIES: DUF202 domain-containing protein [Streptomyces]KMS79330.1 hypothetical protein ACZ91_61840 [Streptomyces regensis]KOG74839.1 hypothetical protein ADK77_04050 [Streptomyces antibioticus]MBG7697746.1 DUF202 domain-containing protein [Streptomyces sp. MC1]
MSEDVPKGATPNTGSRARDHLANERTYLAWLRTGISMAALGVAVAKFAPHRGIHAVAAGAIMLLAGLLISGYGTIRYRSVGRQLDLGLYAPARLGLIIASTVITLIAIIAVLVLI